MQKYILIVSYDRYVDSTDRSLIIVSLKLIQAADQTLPWFVMDILGDYPGLPGIFNAGITCANLIEVRDHNSMLYTMMK
jgi:hypothetical protein